MRKRAEATSQDSGVYQLFQDTGVSRGQGRYYDFQGSVTVPFPPRTSAAPHHGLHCQAPSHLGIFSQRPPFVSPSNPVSFRKTCHIPTAVKSSYGAGSDDLPEGFCFMVPECSATGDWPGVQTRPLRGDAAQHHPPASHARHSRRTKD